MELLRKLKKRLEENKSGVPRGIYSICSAHKTVLEAAMLQAKADHSFLLIESTSNQVNQYGGYTGMTPARFVAYVTGIAGLTDFPAENIIFGGDHLGPNVWQGERAAAAMEKAKVLVRDYIQAGYQKIHLDASMFCADDEGDRHKPLPDTTVAARIAELCRVCETARNPGPGREKAFYIIGTEVPVPGGSKEKEKAIQPTSREGIQKTISLTQKAFFDAGLEEPWGRVIAVVAQPGVEFGDDHIFYYNSGAAEELSSALERSPLVFEAHSTDYQTRSCLRKLVEDHFCILKVGPWLTYRYREAVFSLARMEDELFGTDKRSNLEEVLEEAMVNSAPHYWENYYRGTEAEKRFCRRYSFSDRSRYYWTNPRLQGAVEKLFTNLSGRDIPLSLVSQYMPNLFMPVNEGLVKKTPRDLIIAHIRGIVGLYAEACGFTEGGD